MANDISRDIFLSAASSGAGNDRELRRRVTRARGFVILILMRPILPGRNNFGFIPSTCPDVGAIQQQEQQRSRCFPGQHRQALVMHPFPPNFSRTLGTLWSVVCLLPPLQVCRAHSLDRFPLFGFISSTNHKSLTPSPRRLAF